MVANIHVESIFQSNQRLLRAKSSPSPPIFKKAHSTFEHKIAYSYQSSVKDWSRISRG